MDELVLVPPKYLTGLVPEFKRRIEEISEIIKVLRKEQDELKSIVSSVKLIVSFVAPVNNSHPKVDEQQSSTKAEYDKNAGWFEKAKFVLERENKPLTTAQVVDGIMFYEPQRKRTPVTRVVSSVLGTKSKDEKYLKRFIIDGQNQKFALK